MLITIKFGGTSVGDADRIRKAAELVAAEVKSGHKVVVVTSAMSGVTNKLVALLDETTVGQGDDQSRVTEYFRFTKTLEQDHFQAARRSIHDRKLVEEAAAMLYAERHQLERVLLGSHFLGELTPIGYDFIVSEGERLCVPILAACLKDLGIDAEAIGPGGSGIATDNNYGSARPLEKETRTGVRETLLPMLEAGKTPVVGGFYGRSQQGRIAVLGRGGSDYSATLIGCALDADQIWIMTDVDGIKTTDPRVVPKAHTIAEMPYLVAAEMALLGAKVLHPKSVLPAAKQGVPLRIASSFEPEKPGTMLVPGQPGGAAAVTGLTLVRKATLIRQNSPDLGNESVVAPAMLEELRRQNVDVIASASTANGGSALWLISPLDAERFLSIVQRHSDGRFVSKVQKNVAVLGVVGEQVGSSSGVMAELTRVLQEVDVQPLAVVQGASPNSVVIALPDDDEKLPTTMRTLHTRFGLD